MKNINGVILDGVVKSISKDKKDYIIYIDIADTTDKTISIPCKIKADTKSKRIKEGLYIRVQGKLEIDNKLGTIIRIEEITIKPKKGEDTLYIIYSVDYNTEEISYKIED